MLEKLYTNSSMYSLLGSLSKFLVSLGVKKSIISRFAQRNPAIPKSMVYSSDLPLIKEKLSKNVSVFEQNEIMYQSLSQKFIKQGLGNADCVYSMYFENIEFVRFAKQNNLKIVVDVYENPNAFSSLIDEINGQKEYAVFSGLLDEFEGKALFREKYINQMLELADYYTIPSDFVRKSLLGYSSFDSKKVRIIPYPSSIQVKQYNYRPIKHKLIWVGNDAVRKGLVYCAKAATILKKVYPDLQFNVLGAIDEQIKNSETFSDLTFLGVRDKKSLIEEFETAEAYVFPTLFEGFAGTVIEAASCGTPVITTENSGMDPEDFPGIFIAEKNVEAIVAAVTTIFEDSVKRDKISKDIYEFSRTLSPEVYEEKLIGFFKSIES